MEGLLRGRTVALDERQREFEHRLDLVIEFGGPGARAFFREENGFAGRTFHELGRGRDSESHPERITIEDLLAVTLLDVWIPPGAVRRLLGPEGGKVAQDLATVRYRNIWDADDWSESDGGFKGAWATWRRLLRLNGVGPVVAPKIMARLRPSLIPIRDSVTKTVLGYTRRDNDWKLFGFALSDEERRREAERLQAELGSPRIPLLRVLDAATWMLGGRSERIEWALGRLDKPSWGGKPEGTREFQEARHEFWQRLGETDPWTGRRTRETDR